MSTHRFRVYIAALICLFIVSGFNLGDIWSTFQTNLIEVAISKVFLIDGTQDRELDKNYLNLADEAADSGDSKDRGNLRLGTVFLASDEIDLAATIFRNLSINSLEYRLAYQLLGKYYLIHGDEDKGFMALRKSRAKLFLTDVGLRAFDDKDYPKAARAWQVAVEICVETGLRDPEDIEMATFLYARLGQVKTYQGEYDSAINAYESYLKLRPDEPSIQWKLGDIYRVVGQFEEAKSWLLKASKEEPSSPEPYYHLGMLAYDQGKWDVAVPWYLEALSRYPEWTAARFQLGKAYEALGEFNLAFEVYSAAVELEGDVRDRMALGMLCERMGCIAIAIAQFQTILLSDPDNLAAQEHLNSLLNDQSE